MESPRFRMQYALLMSETGFGSFSVLLKKGGLAM
jgi:hypothetical protein